MNNSRIAFKYRSGDAGYLQRDLDSLQSASFYAAARGSLNDPFEGRFDRTPFDALIQALEGALQPLLAEQADSLRDLKSAANEVLAFVDKSGVFSLSYNPLNELIWAHYGGCHKGFCVGYDLDRLVEFEPNTHCCIDVEYADVVPSLNSPELLRPCSATPILKLMLGIKSKAWEYEQEVRIVTSPPGAHAHDFRAVKVVYFGLRCEEATRLAVMEKLAGRNVRYEQVVSPDGTYTLASEPIADAFAAAPAYMQTMAPIQDGAIYTSHLKPEQQPFAKYLSMAAEIFRREPYCQEVQLVDFSGSQSAPGKPIIFVQYLRGPNKWVTCHLSIPEIEEQFAKLSGQATITID